MATPQATEPPEMKSNPILTWLEGKQPNRVPVELIQDHELAKRLHDARNTRAFAALAAQASPDDKAKVEAMEAAQALVEEIEGDASSSSLKLVFVGLPADELDALEREHPPTREQVRAARAFAQNIGMPPQTPHLNQETYVPALMAKACVEPGMDLETAKALYGAHNLNAGERNKLIDAVQGAQLDPARG